jgi:hypothetical protein
MRSGGGGAGGSANQTLLDRFKPANQASNSRSGAGFQFASEVDHELHHLVLSASHGGQMGSEVHDRTHESLVHDLLLREGGLGGGGGGYR